jgi:hypothetical protein
MTKEDLHKLLRAGTNRLGWYVISGACIERFHCWRGLFHFQACGESGPAGDRKRLHDNLTALCILHKLSELLQLARKRTADDSGKARNLPFLRPCIRPLFEDVFSVSTSTANLFTK